MTKSLSLLALCATLILFMSACQDTISPNLEESLDLFAGLQDIPEAQQTTVTISKGSDESMDGYFSIIVDNLSPNRKLSPGVYDAWCLEWQKNLRSDGDLHNDVKWFDTATNSNWSALNHFLNEKNNLQAEDPDLTYRDFQAVVWVLAGEMGIAPKFDVMNLPVNQLPSRLRSGNEAAIDRQKVANIASRMTDQAPEAVIPTSGVVAQTASDEQNIIVIPPTPSLTADLVTTWDTRLAPEPKLFFH